MRDIHGTTESDTGETLGLCGGTYNDTEGEADGDLEHKIDLFACVSDNAARHFDRDGAQLVVGRGKCSAFVVLRKASGRMVGRSG